MFGGAILAVSQYFANDYNRFARLQKKEINGFVHFRCQST